MRVLAMLRRNIAAIASMALIAACTQQGGVRYQVPIVEARQALMTAELPPMVFGSDPPETEVQADGPSEIVWIARRNNAELFRYVAHLTEDGGGATRVRVELKGARGGPAGDIAKSLSDHPKIRDMYLVAMNERVASTLEHRPFEMSRIYPAMTAAAVANMGALQASADQAAAASQQQDRDTIAKAYRDEAAGRR
jgi:hypothetical protein